MKNKLKKSNNKIIEYICSIILILLIILCIYGIFQTKILNKSYINLFGYTMFEVITGSMRDTIEIGDTVIVKITNDVKENDIIVYQYNNNCITHRLIKKEHDGKLITKGDANNIEDNPINKEQVIGKVICIIPKWVT